jgi:hypothetical protein
MDRGRCNSLSDPRGYSRNQHHSVATTFIAQFEYELDKPDQQCFTHVKPAPTTFETR